MPPAEFHGTLHPEEFDQKGWIMAEHSHQGAGRGTGNPAEDKAIREADPVHARPLKRGWLLLDLCILVASIVLFNVFPDRVGVLISATDTSTFVPLLAPEFQAQMPWVNLWWGLALLLTVVKLVYGRWTAVLLWADWGLRVLGIRVLVALILGGPILRPDAGWGSIDVPLWSALGGGILQPNVLLKLGLGLWAAVLTAKLVSRLLYLIKVAPILQWDWSQSN
jgi:hypothetical protein